MDERLEERYRLIPTRLVRTRAPVAESTVDFAAARRYNRSHAPSIVAFTHGSRHYCRVSSSWRARESTWWSVRDGYAASSRRIFTTTSAMSPSAVYHTRNRQSGNSDLRWDSFFSFLFIVQLYSQQNTLQLFLSISTVNFNLNDWS